MICQPIHSQNAISLMNIRPNIHVEIPCPKTPTVAPFLPNKAHDILTVIQLQLESKGCGRLRRGMRSAPFYISPVQFSNLPSNCLYYEKRFTERGRL